MYDILLTQINSTNHNSSTSNRNNNRIHSPNNSIGLSSPKTQTSSSISPSSSSSYSSSTAFGILPEFSALEKLQFALEKNMLFAASSAGGSSGGLSSPSPPALPALAPKASSRASAPVSSPPAQKRKKLPLTSNHKQQARQEPYQNPSQLHSSVNGNNNNIVSLEPMVPENVFECPLCSIVCNDRHSFNEHLTTHTQHHVCRRCNFITTTKESLDLHLAQVHSINNTTTTEDEEEEGDFDDEGIPVPKVISGSKHKSFKCKSCPHISTTKKQYWAHSKVHIKQDKALQCPKCPFVTEYKHHLEYHLRNHTNSKPFQCTHCSYSCVNKSMLASHLKSHSTIYQYRCKDCDYCTKYCHSLKIHLRKYGHEPSPVLNLDGTINSLTIIDVYGTRRGPKIKNKPVGIPADTLCVRPKKCKKTQGSNNNSRAACGRKEESEGQIQKKASQLAVIPNLQEHQQESQNQKVQIQLKQKIKTEITPEKVNGKRTSKSHHHQQQQLRQVHKQRDDSPLPSPPSSKNLKLTPTTNLLQELLLQQNTQKIAPRIATGIMQNPKLNGRGEGNGNCVRGTPPSPQFPPNLLEFYRSAVASHYLNPSALQFLFLQQQQQQQQQRQFITDSSSPSPPTPSDYSALDLTSRGGIGANRSQGQLTCDMGNEKSRSRSRKGLALKYVKHAEEDEKERYSFSSEEDEDDEDVPMQALDFSNNNNNNNEKEINQEKLQQQNHHQSSQVLRCVYCEISFPDTFLYNLHMNYHAINSGNPFQCKCGVKTKDKVSFYIHLTEKSH